MEELEVREKVKAQPEPAAGVETSPEGDTEVQVPSLEEREKAVLMKENTIELQKVFAQADIPEDLLPFCLSENKDEQDAKFKTLKGAWERAVKAGLKKTMGSTPPVRPPVIPAKPFAEMSYNEKLELKRSNPEAYKRAAGRT